jgi:hypothetical protein
MLEKKINTKQELLKLLQAATISQVVAKDIHIADDVNVIKKEGLKMLQEKKKVTVILLAT